MYASSWIADGVFAGAETAYLGDTDSNIRIELSRAKGDGGRETDCFQELFRFLPHPQYGVRYPSEVVVLQYIRMVNIGHLSKGLEGEDNTEDQATLTDLSKSVTGISRSASAAGNCLAWTAACVESAMSNTAIDQGIENTYR